MLSQFHIRPETTASTINSSSTITTSPTTTATVCIKSRFNVFPDLAIVPWKQTENNPEKKNWIKQLTLNNSTKKDHYLDQKEKKRKEKRSTHIQGDDYEESSQKGSLFLSFFCMFMLHLMVAAELGFAAVVDAYASFSRS